MEDQPPGADTTFSFINTVPEGKFRWEETKKKF